MNIHQQTFSITKEHKEKQKNQRSCTIWMSGLSGSGKSTLADRLDSKLFELGYHSFILDGDNTRLGLNNDLGFSEEDRIENLRRVSEVSKLMNQAGLIVICSFISPLEKNRTQAKNIIGGDFIEVYVKTSIETCESRDPKGLYKKARAGEIKDFTGISSPFDIPTNGLALTNEISTDIDKNVEILLEHLKKHNYIK